MSQPRIYYVALYYSYVEPAGSGTISPASQGYAVGDTAVITAVPYAGYVFDHWYFDDGTTSYDNPVNILMDRNKAVAVIFRSATQKTLTITTTLGGTTIPSPGIHGYDVNSVVSGITAYPSSGYTFLGWVLDGTPRIDNPITVTMDTDHTLEAQFTGAPLYSNVTITTSGQGSTDPPAENYPATYLQGSTLHVTAYPSYGWTYDRMQRNGVDWTTANPGEFLNLGPTEVITVIFRQEIVPPPQPGPSAEAVAAVAIGLSAAVAIAYGIYQVFFAT